jgi:hypothetical protein
VIYLRSVIALGLLAVGAANAFAQPAGAQAEILFRKGKDLLAHGKTAEACAAFDESEKLEPGVTTVLNQANCREKNGQIATAWGLFLEADRQTRAATDSVGKQLHQVAADHAQKLESRLSTLKISVPAESRTVGLEIRRDGELVDAAVWNQALPIDGGTYAIAAHAPGNADWTGTVTVGGERDAKTIDIPKLAPAVLAPPAPTDHSVPSAPKGPSAPTDSVSDRHPSSRVPLVLGGAAVALAAGAIGFELWGDSTYDQTKQGTDAQKLDAWHSANDKRYVAEGMGVAALGCATVAVWLYVANRHESDEVAARGMVITPVVASERAGLALIGRF